MSLNVTAEFLQSQLGYSDNKQIISQIEEIINNTPNFNKFSKHIVSLNDKLKHMNSYIAVSNSVKHFKIKCDEIKGKNIIEDFLYEVNKWSNKYNVKLEKLNNKNVYYIIGSIE